MSPRRPTDEQIAARVRARIVAAENRIPVPPDLMQRVTASTPRPEFERPRRRWSTMIVAVAAVPGLLCGVTGAVVARAWHGDTVTAISVVPDGKRVLDESGVSSTRWYRVRTAKGVIGYLPGVRTRNSVEIQVCPTQR